MKNNFSLLLLITAILLMWPAETFAMDGTATDPSRQFANYQITDEPAQAVRAAETAPQIAGFHHARTEFVGGLMQVEGACETVAQNAFPEFVGGLAQRGEAFSDPDT